LRMISRLLEILPVTAGGDGAKGGVLKPLFPGAQLTFRYVHRISLLVANATDTSAPEL